MSLIGNAIKSKFTIKAVNPNGAVSLFLRDWPKHFSTESEQPPSPEDAAVDSFLQTPRTGAVYGKLSGPARLAKYTLKTDILNLLEGSNLTPDDVKVMYNSNYVPVGMILQFPSRNAYDDAFRAIGRKGRLYRLERADPSQWDVLPPYGGKTVLLEGIPRNALMEDVDRFLSGCDHDTSSIQMLTRPGFPDPTRFALIHFPSPTQAMNAFIKKNRSFCLNSQISVRVLQ